MLKLIRTLIEDWRHEFKHREPVAPSFGEQGWQLIWRAWQLWRAANPERARGWCVNTYGKAAFASRARAALEAFMSRHGRLPDAQTLVALTSMGRAPIRAKTPRR